MIALELIREVVGRKWDYMSGFCTLLKLFADVVGHEVRWNECVGNRPRVEMIVELSRSDM